MGLSVPQLEDLPLPHGTRVLVRTDFNVPVDANGNISDDLRIRAAIPTIEWLRQHHCSLVLCSHMGRPKGQRDLKYSMAPIAQRLGE